MSKDELSFLDIDMEGFDFTLEEETIIKKPTCRCEFKECIQVRNGDKYFCDYHAFMVYPKDAIVEKQVEKKRSISSWDTVERPPKCGVNNCRKMPAVKSNLCDFHALDVSGDLMIIKRFQCKKRKCTDVQEFNSTKCLFHL